MRYTDIPAVQAARIGQLGTDLIEMVYLLDLDAIVFDSWKSLKSAYGWGSTLASDQPDELSDSLCWRAVAAYGVADRIPEHHLAWLTAPLRAVLGPQTPNELDLRGMSADEILQTLMPSDV